MFSNTIAWRRVLLRLKKRERSNVFKNKKNSRSRVMRETHSERERERLLQNETAQQHYYHI